MKTISAPLKAALATGKRCYLLKITGKDGVDYGYTNHDKELTYSGTTFLPAAGLKHLNTYYSDDAEVSSSKFELAFVDVDEDLVAAGVFDNAQYAVWRVAWDNLAVGHYVHDVGTMAANIWDENSMTHESHGYQRDLAKTIGVVHTLLCPHTFGDDYGRTKPGACTLNIASHTTIGAVSALVVQRMQMEINTTGKADDYFTSGMLTFTSGDNNGLSFPVMKHIVGGTEQINFAIPTFQPIQVSDTFTVIAGCDKTFEQCVSKFSNGINFGGDPFMNPGVTRR